MNKIVIVETGGIITPKIQLNQITAFDVLSYIKDCKQVSFAIDGTDHSVEFLGSRSSPPDSGYLCVRYKSRSAVDVAPKLGELFYSNDLLRAAKAITTRLLSEDPSKASGFPTLVVA